MTLLIVWIAGQFGLDVPTEVAVAMTTVLSFVAGYIVPDPRRVEG